MARALLFVPHFWDPICCPLGISSLKAYAEAAGHQVDLFDMNTVQRVFSAQRDYFDEGKRQFPRWKDWFIERNAAEALALHQIIYLFGRDRPDYPELVAEVLNLDQRPHDEFMDVLEVKRFDAIFDKLYATVGRIVDDLLDRSQPDVVGCTVLNPTWPASLFIMRRAKERMPQVRTVVGGPGPLMGIAANEEEVREFFDSHDFLDYYVIGEGEVPFVNILENPDLPRGIIDPQKGLDVDAAKANSLDLKELPVPDYRDLDINRYLLLSSSSSRGCPFECSFCAETVFWKGFRMRPRDLVYDQLDQLGQRHNRSSFFICDSLSNHVIGPLSSSIAENGRPYKLDCYLRADAICTDEKRTKEWRKGGLFRARMGMESGSQRILDAMVKKTNPENMAKSLRALANAGVMTSTLWIIYFPGETEEEFKETLRFIRENSNYIYQADAQVFQYHPEGLAHSEDIEDEQGSKLRFSDGLNEVLSITPHVTSHGFSAEVAFDRLRRYVETMREIEVPNPYGIGDWVAAQNRWKGMGMDSGWSPFESIKPMVQEGGPESGHSRPQRESEGFPG